MRYDTLIFTIVVSLYPFLMQWLHWPLFCWLWVYFMWTYVAHWRICVSWHPDCCLLPSVLFCRFVGGWCHGLLLYPLNCLQLHPRSYLRMHPWRLLWHLLHGHWLFLHGICALLRMHYLAVLMFICVTHSTWCNEKLCHHPCIVCDRLGGLLFEVFHFVAAAAVPHSFDCSCVLW